MFSDLKKGFQVHTLDTNTVPKYELGKVVAVSEPRYLPPQPGQYQAMQTRVVDLTVELTGETKAYTVPESQNVAKAMGITLSTSIDPIMNELNAIKNTSQDIINSVDAHRAKIEACESILEDINPALLPRRKNKLEGSDLRSRSRSFRWCGSHSKKYDSRIPVFPVWKKKNKNIIPVGGQ